MSCLPAMTPSRSLAAAARPISRPRPRVRSSADGRRRRRTQRAASLSRTRVKLPHGLPQTGGRSRCQGERTAVTKTGVKQVQWPKVGPSGLIQYVSEAGNSGERAMRAARAGRIFRQWFRMLRAQQESGETVGSLKPGPLRAGRVLLFRTVRGLADGLLEAKPRADAKAGTRNRPGPRSEGNPGHEPRGQHGEGCGSLLVPRREHG